MGKRIVLDTINKDVLKWARESSYIDIETANEKLNKKLTGRTKETSLYELERGARKPDFRELKALAKIYRMTYVELMLSKVPKETPLPEYFRASKKKHFSHKEAVSIRKVQEIQELFTEIARMNGLPTEFKLKRFTTNNKSRKEAKIIAANIRQILRIDWKIQLRWKDNTEALECYKRRIEDFGVIVTEFRGVDSENIRGFLLKEEPPTISLNFKDEINGRIFTLFHELGHLLLNNADISTPASFEDYDSQEEVFCNAFAGSVLVPDEEFEQYHKKIYNGDMDKFLKEAAKAIKVSSSVILRKLLDLKKISNEVYDHKYDQLKKEYEENKKKKGGGRGGRQYHKEALREYGFLFTNLVFNSYHKRQITSIEAGRYLRINRKVFDELEEII